MITTHHSDQGIQVGIGMTGMMEEATLQRIERESSRGLTSVQILELLREHGVSFSEATLRKYVQLGLLPRSVRVGQKGKHRGSKGLYPARVVRQIVLIKEMMAARLTIEQIQKEFLFLSGELDQLDDVLGSVFRKLGETTASRKAGTEGLCHLIEREVLEAKAVGIDLVSRLRSIERRLSSGYRALPGLEGLRHEAV